MPRAFALLFLVLLVAAAACSSPAKHVDQTPGDDVYVLIDAAAAPAPDAGPVALTDGDCERLIDHILEVQIVEMRKHKKPDEVPTDEQVAKLRVQLRTEMMDECKAWSRPSYECIIAAPDLAAVQVCAGEP
jgi:hypothetical protein